jgi:hypothetical protein
MTLSSKPTLKRGMKAVESVLNYIFEHEFEDYVDTLKEQFPDDTDYIEECRREGNITSLDKYAWNGTTEVPHVYADAVIAYRELLK